MTRRSFARSTALVIGAVAVAGCVNAPTGVPVASPPIAPIAISTTVAPPSTSARLLTAARQYVFRLRNDTCLATGSSFAVSGGIVTNRHVAGGASDLDVSTWNGTDVEADVRSIAAGPDLALLTPHSASTSVPRIRRTKVTPGAGVWAAGYPEGDQLSIEPGKLLDYVSGRPFGEPGQVMRISNRVQHGNSGGPLLDSQGRVVGIVFAIETDNGDGLAIPASTVKSFLGDPGGIADHSCSD